MSFHHGGGGADGRHVGGGAVHPWPGQHRAALGLVGVHSLQLVTQVRFLILLFHEHTDPTEDVEVELELAFGVNGDVIITCAKVFSLLQFTVGIVATGAGIVFSARNRQKMRREEKKAEGRP